VHFQHDRLPEVFAGFARADYHIPVRYPVACHPQAWAAGAVPFMLEQALGLMPDGFARRLRIVRPVLPDFAGRLEVRRLRVAQARVDLRFERTAAGEVGVHVLRVDGDLDVSVQNSG
jgi:glycogen debranching enzyme